MKKNYIKPEMIARRFKDRITADAGSTASAAGFTAAQDLTNQAQNIMIKSGVTGTISTVKLESIMGYSN